MISLQNLDEDHIVLAYILNIMRHRLRDISCVSRVLHNPVSRLLLKAEKKEERELT
jgi:hypothetical protein